MGYVYRKFSRRVGYSDAAAQFDCNGLTSQIATAGTYCTQHTSRQKYAQCGEHVSPDGSPFEPLVCELPTAGRLKKKLRAVHLVRPRVSSLSLLIGTCRRDEIPLTHLRQRRLFVHLSRSSVVEPTTLFGISMHAVQASKEPAVGCWMGSMTSICDPEAMETALVVESLPYSWALGGRGPACQ